MNYDNNMNGYTNYYPQTTYNPAINYQRPVGNQYFFVNGIEGAKNYQMLPGQTVLLMDNDNLYVYMKSANQLGQTTIRYFKLVETSESAIKGPSSNEYVLRSELDELKAKLDKLSSKKEKEKESAE